MRKTPSATKASQGPTIECAVTGRTSTVTKYTLSDKQTHTSIYSAHVHMHVHTHIHVHVHPTATNRLSVHKHRSLIL